MSIVPITRDFGRALAVADRNGTAVASDLILTHTPEGDLVLYHVSGNRISALGIFEDVTDAWRALDALDAPQQVTLAA